jgi:hypothetical protein
VRRQLLLALVVMMALGALSRVPAAISQDIDVEEIARTYLAQQSVAGQAPGESLELLGVRESPGAYHARFQQAINGIPVFGAYATVSISKGRGRVSFAIERRSNVALESASGASIGADGAIEIARGAAAVTKLRGGAMASETYFPVGGADILAWEVRLPAADPIGDWLVIVAVSDGRVLLQQDTLRFDTGQVFDPNPVIASGGSVPPPDDCSSNEDAQALASLMTTKTLQGIRSGQNRLRGEYVDVTAPNMFDGSLPAGVADEPSRNYVYPCDDDRFEEVMAYYHIDAAQRHIQELGFTDERAIMDRPVGVHAHYDEETFDNTCNGFYSGFDLGIRFGEGTFLCPDSAEDADFIVHEYGHALQDDQVPGWGDGPAARVDQALSMGEGFSDFLAAALNGDPCWAEWSTLVGQRACDGERGWRWLQNDRVFPEDFEACGSPEDSTITEPHCGGLIWGGALWDVVEALGGDEDARDAVLTIVLASHFYLDRSATFSEAAASLMQADADLNDGANATVIYRAMTERGIELAVRGDASCDGVVDAIDASLMLQLSAGIVETLSCEDEADVNDDGQVSALDAALVLQFDAGIIDSLPA